MIIRWVELKNIRSYKEQNVSFPNGSVLLWGDVGSGKSTILLAIEFALFGLMRGSVSGSSLLRHGSKEGSVELDLKIDKKRITIKRVLKRGKSGVQQDSGYIVIDGEKKYGTAVELKAWILDILQYPKELLSKSKSLIYRYTVYTPQDEMKRILLEDAEQRLDTLRRVFQIDKYKRIRENTIILNRRIKQKVREMNAQIFDLDEKIKREKERGDELKELKLKIKEIRPLWESGKKKVVERKKWVEKIEEDVKKFNELNSSFEVENAKLIEKIAQDSRNKEELTVVEKEVNLLVEKISGLKVGEVNESFLAKDIEKRISEVNKIKEEKAVLGEKLNVVAKRIDELNLEIKNRAELSKELIVKEELLKKLKNDIIVKEELKKNILLLEKELENINKRINGAEIKIRNSKELKEKVIGLDNCPLCKQSVSSEHKEHIKQLEDKNILAGTDSMKILNAKKKELSERCGGLKKKLDDVLEKEKKYFEIGVEVKSLKEISGGFVEKQKKIVLDVKEREEFKERIEKLNNISVGKRIKEINELKKLLDGVKEKNNLKKMLEDKKKRNGELMELRDVIKKDVGKINIKKMGLREKISELKGIKEIYDKERFALDGLMKEEKELEVKFAVLNKEIEGIERLREMLKKEIDKKLKTRKEISNLKGVSGWLDEGFMNLMIKMEKRVMLKVYTEFNELFTKWFDILLEDEELGARLDDEFKPVIEQNGYETEIDNLSGGEKTALALAYRLALNKVINDVVESIKTKDIIILDEPTDGFSTEQLDKMRDVLEQLEIKQTIIVSHENKIESFVEKVLRVSKSEHISVVN